MNNYSLTRAIAVAMTGGALSLSAATDASAHVMYNTYNAYASNIGTDSAVGLTDGWSSSGGWVGTSSGATPFGTTLPS